MLLIAGYLGVGVVTGMVLQKIMDPLGTSAATIPDMGLDSEDE